MVHQNDIRKHNEYRQDFQEALHDIQDIQEAAAETGGDPTNHPDWTDAQARLNEAIRALYAHIDDVTSRSDTLEDGDGNTLANLPDAAVSRSNSTKMPSPPQ